MWVLNQGPHPPLILMGESTIWAKIYWQELVTIWEHGNIKIIYLSDKKGLKGPTAALN